MKYVLAEGPRFRNALLNKLRRKNDMAFGISPSNFESLPLMVTGIIRREDAKFREPFPVSLRLAVTLLILASGGSFTSLAYTFSHLSRRIHI